MYNIMLQVFRQPTLKKWPLIIIVFFFLLASTPNVNAQLQELSEEEYNNMVRGIKMMYEQGWHYGVIYDITSGISRTPISTDNLKTFDNVHYYYPYDVNPWEAFEIVDNYPENEKYDILIYTPYYIYDFDLVRLRKMTKDEKKVVEEMWRQKYLQNILRSKTTLPDNRIRVTLEWSTYFMYVETNSSVFGVKFDSTTKQIYINLRGQSGIPGELDLLVPQGLISSVSDVSILLDSGPIKSTITQSGDYYLIHVGYTHSLHVLTVNLVALPAWYAQPLNLALITLAIVAAIGAVYWFKFRKR